MKLKKGDQFYVIEFDKTELAKMYPFYGVHEVISTGKTPKNCNEPDKPCVFFKIQGDKQKYFARIDCIRKLTKLEKALK
jgi:hypothetical protein